MQDDAQYTDSSEELEPACVYGRYVPVLRIEKSYPFPGDSCAVFG